MALVFWENQFKKNLSGALKLRPVPREMRTFEIKEKLLKNDSTYCASAEKIYEILNRRYHNQIWLLKHKEDQNKK